MTSELVRRVMNNIASKKIDQIPRRNTEGIKNDYEYQKKISLLNYSSPKNENYNSNKKGNKKAMDLNSLADEIRGVSQSDKALIQSKDNIVKDHKNNKMTLSDLSKLSGGKDEESKIYKTPNSSSSKNNKKNMGLSLEDLANSIKKNI